MVTLSQRDPRWKDTILGFNTDPQYTIGGWGCVITSLAMQAGLTPDVVNERLKAVNGFTAGSGLIIWSKIKEAIPWLEFKQYGYEYNNDAVLQAINDYGSCIVRVDFDGKIATPTDYHYVLYTGNGEMKDPWTGVVKSTGYYPLVQAYVVIKVATPANPIPTEQVVTDQTKLLIDGKLEEWQAIRSELSDKRKIIPDLESKANRLKALIDNLNQTWGLPTGSDEAEILTEAKNLLLAEDTRNQYRTAIETAVGTFNNDNAMLDALLAIKKDRDKLADQLAECQLKLANGGKVIWAKQIGSYTMKIYSKRG